MAESANEVFMREETPSSPDNLSRRHRRDEFTRHETAPRALEGEIGRP